MGPGLVARMGGTRRIGAGGAGIGDAELDRAELAPELVAQLGVAVRGGRGEIPEDALEPGGLRASHWHRPSATDTRRRCPRPGASPRGRSPRGGRPGGPGVGAVPAAWCPQASRCISAQRSIAASAVWSLPKAAPYQRWKSGSQSAGPGRQRRGLAPIAVLVQGVVAGADGAGKGEGEVAEHPAAVHRIAVQREARGAVLDGEVDQVDVLHHEVAGQLGALEADGVEPVPLSPRVSPQSSSIVHAERGATKSGIRGMPLTSASGSRAWPRKCVEYGLPEQ